MKVARHYRASTRAAAQALGSMIAGARRARGWPAAEFAGRLGVSVPTLRRIERGEPTVAIGLVFEAAVLGGVELFSTPAEELSRVARQARLETAVLPARARKRPVVIDDDF